MNGMCLPFVLSFSLQARLGGMYFSRGKWVKMDVLVTTLSVG